MYANRVFSDDFHDFVADSSILEPAERPSAYELLSIHPFIRQFMKKIGGDKSKSQSDSIITAFLTGIKNKESPNTFRAHNHKNDNLCNDSVKQDLPKTDIKNNDWVF